MPIHKRLSKSNQKPDEKRKVVPLTESDAGKKDKDYERPKPVQPDRNDNIKKAPDKIIQGHE